MRHGRIRSRSLAGICLVMFALGSLSLWKLPGPQRGQSAARGCRGCRFSTAAVPAFRSPVIAGLMRRVEACNDGQELAAVGRPLLVKGVGQLGSVSPISARELAKFPDVFRIDDNAVELITGGESVDEKSKAVMRVLESLRADGTVPMLQGWRNEGWPVKANFGAPAEIIVERAAGPLFGVRDWGCHVNGLVMGENGSQPESLWVARRARTKPTYPGKLDHLVAGGLGHGEQPGDNVVKECAEEASIPHNLAVQARPASIVQCCKADETQWGVKQETLFCYDLVLPSDFKPSAADGEVESFELWDIPKVIDSLAADNDDWKPNVALVIIDMLVRRGFLAPEDDGYVDLVRSLRG